MSLIKYDSKWMDENGFLTGALPESTASNIKGKGMYPFHYLTGECVIHGSRHKKTEVTRPTGVVPMWLPFIVREREVYQQTYFNITGNSQVAESNLLPAVAIIRMGGISVRLGQLLDYNNKPDATNTVERWVMCIGPNNELTYVKNAGVEHSDGSGLLNIRIGHIEVPSHLVPLNLQTSCNELALKYDKDYFFRFQDLLRERLTMHELIYHEVNQALVDIYREIQKTDPSHVTKIGFLLRAYYGEIDRSVKVSEKRKNMDTKA